MSSVVRRKIRSKKNIDAQTTPYQINTVQHYTNSSPPKFTKEKLGTSLQLSHKGNPDTGTTGNYMTIHDMDILVDVRATPYGIRVRMPNGSEIKSTHVGLL